jgi:hypothetical protein
MTGRRNDPWDKPWVTIAVIIGIVAVVAIALVFFIGSGNISVPAPSVQTTVVPSGTSTQKTIVSGTTVPQVVPTTVSIPVTGVFVKVSYIGGFSGNYGVNGVIQKVRNSGDRLYEVTNSTGNFSATFKKEDASAKHEITVELWKNGKSLTSAKNSTPFGNVNINYTL